MPIKYYNIFPFDLPVILIEGHGDVREVTFISPRLKMKGLNYKSGAKSMHRPFHNRLCIIWITQ